MSLHIEDHELLRRYARQGSEEAFTELVRRHIDHVYSAAWREVREAHLAADLTQAAFILLARKAGVIRGQVSLSGWLFQTVRYAARNARRADWRRKHYENEAAAMIPTPADSDAASLYEQLAPCLNDALASLSASDRSLVTLRFFEKKSHEEIGARLGTSEAVARKRLSRAVERLRLFFARRGVAVTGVSILAVLANCNAGAAPAGLAGTVLAGAMAKGAGASAPVSALVQGVLKTVMWAKIKASGLGALAVLVIGGLAYSFSGVPADSQSGYSLDEVQFTSRFLDEISGEEMATAGGHASLFVRTRLNRRFDAFGLWRQQKPATNLAAPPVIFQVADDRGDSVEGTFLKRGRATTRFQSELWEVPFFPRRGTHLWLRLLDRDFRLLAEWKVPNPAFAAHAELTPQPLPVWATAGDLSVGLEEFVSGPLTGAGFPRRRTQMTCALREKDQASRSWALRAIQIEDATGNHWVESRPAVEPLPGPGARLSVRLYTALWPGEPAWRVGLELMRTNEFEARHLLALPRLPIPAANTEARLDQQFDLRGEPVRLLSLSGPQRGVDASMVQPPGHLILQIEARDADPDWRLGLVELPDDLDRAWRVTDHQRDGSRATFRLHGPSGAAALSLKLAYQELRRVTFLARTAAVEFGAGNSRLHPVNKTTQ